MNSGDTRMGRAAKTAAVMWCYPHPELGGTIAFLAGY